MENKDKNCAVIENQRIWSVATLLSLVSVSLVLFLGYNFINPLLDVQRGVSTDSVVKAVDNLKGLLSSELIDRTVWIISLTVTAMLVLPVERIRGALYRNEISTSQSTFTFACFTASICITPIFAGLNNILWFGFGNRVFLTTCIFIPILIYFQKKPNQVILRWISTRMILLFVFYYLPTLLQPLWAIKDLYHSSYIINEILAPVRAVFPTSEMAAQYSNIMGIPLIPIAYILGIDGSIELQQLATYYLTILTIITFAIIWEITRRVSPKELKNSLLFFPIFFILVTPSGSSHGVITGLFSIVPVRMLLVFVIGLMLIHRNSSTDYWCFSIGFVAALASINNLEFGLPTLAAALAVKFMSVSRTRTKTREISVVLFGIFFGWILFVTVMAISGHDFRIENYSLFVRSFAGGFGVEPMPVFGPHVFVLSILVSGVATGTLHLSRTNGLEKGTDLQGRGRSAAITAMYFGLMGLTTFPYFVNRSVISGQLQAFLFFVAPIIVSSFSLLKIGELQLKSRRNIAMAIVLVFPQALLFGSIIQRPSGVDEWRRVINTQAAAYESQLFEVELAVAEAESFLKRRIEFFSITNGNLFLGQDGRQNISLIDNPSDLHQFSTLDNNMLQKYCKNIDLYSEAENSVIFVQDFFDNGSGVPLCPNYRKVLVVSEKFAVIARAT
jgi:hypothetical protein